jgi:hypothetical protein
MDRSFLSSEQLIKVSRDFVCIRTATYEDKEEAAFLKRTFVTRAGGTLRNFGYCVLSPDGQQKLRRSDRGPNFVYANSNAMAADLRRVASQYRGKTTGADSMPPVPRIKNVRLGINVASCDGLPAVVVVGQDQREVDALNKKLSDVIWNEGLAGKFIYSSTSNRNDLKIIKGVGTRTGILVVRPDTYGLQGQVMTAIAPDVSGEELEKSLLAAASTFRRNSKVHGLHVRNGRQSNTTWETEVPVPDRVRSRTRGTSGRRPRP